MMRQGAMLLAALALAGCGAEGEDPLQAESIGEIRAGHELAGRFGQETRPDSTYAEKREAPRMFGEWIVVCARDREPENPDYARVMLIDGVRFADSPLQGDWFGYVWKQAGC